MGEISEMRRRYPSVWAGMIVDEIRSSTEPTERSELADAFEVLYKAMIESGVTNLAPEEIKIITNAL